MQIEYKNKRIRDICQNASKAERKYGINMADRIHSCVDYLIAATSIDMLIQNRIGRCHTLKGNRNGQYAKDLVHPYRLVFTVDKSGYIQIVEVLEIVDYH